MEEFAERIAKFGRFLLKLLVALSLIQIVLRALGLDVQIPVVTQFIDLVIKLFSNLARMFNNILTAHTGYS